MTGPRPPVHDVVVASLAVRLPDSDPPRPDIERRADLIVAALTEYGYLPTPEHEPTMEDVITAARDLADWSRHPRYLQDESAYTRLLQSEADVDLAAHNAGRYAATQHEQEQVARAKRLLLRHVSRPRRADGEESGS